MLSGIRRLAARALLLSALTFCGACDATPAGIPVSLSPEPEVAVGTRDETPEFRMGIGAMVSSGATLGMYGEIVDLLAADLGMRGVTVQRGNYAEINDMLEQRRIDCALVCTGAYLAGRRSFGMELLAVPVFGGSPTYHSIVIVRKGSGIATFADLRGRRFAFVDPLSNTGRLYPVSRVLYVGSTPGEFFEYQFTHSHDKSIEAVKAGLVDGAAVDELVFNHLAASRPEAVEDLEIIERSPAFGAPPVVVHPDTPREFRDDLRAAFMRIVKSEAGRDALAKLGIDWFMRPPDGLYDYAAGLETRVLAAERKAGGR